MLCAPYHIMLVIPHTQWTSLWLQWKRLPHRPDWNLIVKWQRGMVCFIANRKVLPEMTLTSERWMISKECRIKFETCSAVCVPRLYTTQRIQMFWFYGKIEQLAIYLKMCIFMCELNYLFSVYVFHFLEMMYIWHTTYNVTTYSVVQKHFLLITYQFMMQNCQLNCTIDMKCCKTITTQMQLGRLISSCIW